MVKLLGRVGLLGLLFATLAAGYGVASLEASARGAGESYTATLSGGEEVPPRATPAGYVNASWGE